ncbi:MAG: AgmX/PglI C-terminal domain-containing protein [Myxococcaceae bacterium]
MPDPQTDADVNFICDNCQHRYNIADDKVRGKTVKVRCRHCEHLITVVGPLQEEPAEERTTMMSIEQVERLRKEGAAPQAAAPAAAPSPEWLAMIKGKQSGPFDLRGLAELARAGEINGRTYFWRPGMADWKHGSDVAELASLFVPAVPVPVAAVTPAPDRGDVSLEAPAKGKGVSFGELFSDADLPPSGSHPARQAVEEPLSKAKPKDDPFVALGDFDPSMAPPPGEATQFFIAQAGVNKRNPPWKIAAFVGGGIAALAGVFLLLSSLEVVPAFKLKKTDSAGNVTEQSVFSGEGMAGLGDRLLGRVKKEKDVTRVTPAAAAKDAAPAPETNRPKIDAPVHKPSADELAALYGDASKKSVGPRLRKGAEEKATDTSSGGPSDESIAKVVANNQTAFQFCIEQELRKNPNLRVPKFYLVATVASSGVVKNAGIDRKDIDSSNLGECLKTRAKRMVFAQFSGDDVDVEIPLIVGVAM